jgi:hypothetical protein
MEEQLELPAKSESTDASLRFATQPVGDDGPPDLSQRIVAEVDKLPADRVTCRRISGNHYRCNWWAPQSALGYDNPSMEGLTVTTHRVRKSQCLRVTTSFKGLAIEVV